MNEDMAGLFGSDHSLSDDPMEDDPMEDDPVEVDDNVNSLSLHEFCRRAKDLLSLDQTDFVRFVLTGLDTDDRQASIDPVFNRVTPGDSLDMMRDYDSVLGFSSQIRVNSSITVFPIAKPEDTLSRSIHIRYEFSPANVSFLNLCSNLRHSNWSLGILHGGRPQSP